MRIVPKLHLDMRTVRMLEFGEGHDGLADSAGQHCELPFGHAASAVKRAQRLFPPLTGITELKDQVARDPDTWGRGATFGRAVQRNVFEISMLPHVKERDPDPQRSSGDSQRARYCSAQPEEVRNSTPAHTSPSVLFTSPHP
jgi:hypothetical protein